MKFWFMNVEFDMLEFKNWHSLLYNFKNCIYESANIEELIVAEE